jgi:hypothetical protein
MSLQRDIDTGNLLKVTSGNLAKECCCCGPCVLNVDGVDTDVGCECVYTVTFSGLTDVFADYNGEHEMRKPNPATGGCDWYGETLSLDDSLVLEFFEGTWMVALGLDDATYVTIWGKNWDEETCNIQGNHPWVSTDGPSQSASTCTVGT